MSVLLIVLIVIVVLAVMLIGIYNRLVALRQNANQAFADIDVQLKQRHDLIPNLVETVKGYAAHERGTLEAVVQARNAAIAAPGVEVEPTQMDIHVYFYDKTGPEGRIEPSKADAPDQNWVSAPVDWKDEGREELLDVIYNMPALKPEEVRDIGRRTFYGYVVKLFYRDRLVGEQAAPRDLLDFKPAVAAPAGADNALFPKN